MDIQQLKAFIAICETESFSRAAEQLFITQSAVSKRIASLEKYYGTNLLDRIGKKIIPTPAGNLLLPRARQIMECAKNSRDEIQGLSGKVKGELKLATSHHIGLHRLPPVLRAFKAEFPDVEIDIRFMDSEQACNVIEKGELELAIVTLPQHPSANLVLQHTWTDPLKIVVGKTHALASQTTVSKKQLQQHAAILPSHDTVTRSLIEQALKFDQAPLIAMESNYLETIKMMVSIGLGWSVLPEVMVSDDLCTLDLKQFRVFRELGIVYHRHKTLSSANSALIEVINRYLD